MGMLDSVKLKAERKPPLIVVHGPSGSLKTQMCVDAFQPILALTERGLGNRNAPYVSINKAEDLFDLIKELGTSEHSYRTLCIDSLDHLVPKMVKKVCDDKGKASLEAFGFGKGQEAEEAEWRRLLEWLERLRDTKNMAVLMTAHSTVRAVTNPNLEDTYDRWEAKLPKKVNALVKEMVDIYGCVQPAITLVENEKTGKTKAIGRGEFMLYVSQRPSIDAKNRYHIDGPLEMGWSQLMAAFATANPQE